MTLLGIVTRTYAIVANDFLLPVCERKDKIRSGGWSWSLNGMHPGSCVIIRNVDARSRKTPAGVTEISTHVVGVCDHD